MKQVKKLLKVKKGYKWELCQTNKKTDHPIILLVGLFTDWIGLYLLSMQIVPTLNYDYLSMVLWKMNYFSMSIYHIWMDLFLFYL